MWSSLVYGSDKEDILEGWGKDRRQSVLHCHTVTGSITSASGGDIIRFVVPTAITRLVARCWNYLCYTSLESLSTGKSAVAAF